jgi:hypothetical protein
LPYLVSMANSSDFQVDYNAPLHPFQEPVFADYHDSNYRQRLTEFLTMVTHPNGFKPPKLELQPEPAPAPVPQAPNLNIPILERPL